MHLRTATPIIGCIFVLGSPTPARSQETAGGWTSSGWYLGGSVGATWAGELDQDGWNRDTICYPDHACFDAAPTPSVSGYRWHYGVGASSGVGYEIAVGRIFGRARLALSLAQRSHGLDPMFHSLSYYDGAPVVARLGGTVASHAQASIDHMRVRTLALHAYHDLRVAYGRVVPYVGIGAGPAFATVSGLRFSARYEDVSADAPAYDPPLSFYDGSLEEDLSDTVPAAHLHAGADYVHAPGSEADLLDTGTGGSRRRMLASPDAC